MTIAPVPPSSWSHFDRVVELASKSAQNAALRSGPSHAKRGLAGAHAAGLVPFKTSLQDSFSVNLAPSAVADRRVKRLKRSVWASGHLHGLADVGFRPPQCWFVTLTYEHANGWQADHISKAVQRFRDFCRSVKVPCRYTWVAEIQPLRLERTGQAVVHYHLLAWLPQGVSMPHWDRANARRKAFWPHGMTNTEKAKAGVGYLMKYLSKLGELTRFPKGLRLYGIGGLTQQGRTVRSWFNLPQWIKNSYGVGEVTRSKNRYLVRETGELLQPAYELQKVPFGIILRPLRQIAARLHDGVYSSFPRVAF